MKNELQIVTISCFPARQQKTELTGIGAQKTSRLIMIERQPLSSHEKLRRKWKFPQFRLTLKHFRVVSERISVRTIQSLRLRSEKDASDARHKKLVDASISTEKQSSSWFRESLGSCYNFSTRNWVISSQNGYYGGGGWSGDDLSAELLNGNCAPSTTSPALKCLVVCGYWKQEKWKGQVFNFLE